MQFSFGRAALCAAGLSCALAGTTNASVIWTGSQNNRQAAAEFAVQGTKLIIKLANNGAADATDAADVVTGLFFDISGSSISLSRVSVVCTSGSNAYYVGSGNTAPTDSGKSVGGEWAYKGSLSGAPHGADYGISAADYNGMFSSSNRFSGNNLQGQNSPDGVEYGLTTKADKLNTGNSSISGKAVIKYGVTITLDHLPANFALSRIKNVSFQYGSDCSQRNIQGCLTLPTPGSTALLAASVLVGTRRRRA